jgi:hypothetical protein
MIRRVSPNEPLAIPASAYNAFADAAEAHRRAMLNGGRGVSRDDGRALARVLIQNTGSDVDRYAVLGISGILFSPSDNLEEFQNQPCLTGTTPATASHLAKFAVVQEALPTDAIGWAVISGPAVVQVNVTDADHEWADVKDGDATQLESGATGSARIIYKPAGTGTLWCVVRIGEQRGPMLVTVESDGGDGGGDLLTTGGYSDCTWTYTVKSRDGSSTLATAVTPERARMSGFAYLPGGTGGRSVYGVADLDSLGDVVLLDVFGEVPDGDDCPT